MTAWDMALDELASSEAANSCVVHPSKIDRAEMAYWIQPDQRGCSQVSCPAALCRRRLQRIRLTNLEIAASPRAIRFASFSTLEGTASLDVSIWGERISLPGLIELRVEYDAGRPVHRVGIAVTLPPRGS